MTFHVCALYFLLFKSVSWTGRRRLAVRPVAGSFLSRPSCRRSLFQESLAIESRNDIDVNQIVIDVIQSATVV